MRSAIETAMPAMQEAVGQGGIHSDNSQLTLPILTADGHLRSLSTNAAAVQSIAQPVSGDTVARYVEAASAAETRRAYRGDLEDFLRWGGSIPARAEDIARYIVDRSAAHSPATIARRIVGIGRAHTSLGFANPAKQEIVRAVLRGASRLHGRAQRQATPLLRDDLLKLQATMCGMKGLRDRALILLGFAAALRRSELVGLDVGDLEFVADGLLVHLRRSKTDQSCAGRKIAIPYCRIEVCPVRAVRSWLHAADITSGPAFRSVSKGGLIALDRLSAQSVSLIVKMRASAAGLHWKDFSGHSLRSGLVTSAAKAGVSVFKIQEQSGHRGLASLNRYVRDACIFNNNAAAAVL